MNLNKKKKAMYKSALAVLLSGTMMTGCSKNEEPVQDPNPEVTDPAVNSNDYVMPTETMGTEETSTLTAGQFIGAEELTKMPDYLTLENMELSFVYVYTYLPYEDTEYSICKFGLPIFEFLTKYGDLSEKEAIESSNDYRFEGIEISEIDHYALNADSVWEKVVEVGKESYVTAGLVLSEEKIQELNGTQKVKSK